MIRKTKVNLSDIVKLQNKSRHYYVALPLHKRLAIATFYFKLVLKSVLYGNEFRFPGSGGTLGIYKRKKRSSKNRHYSKAMFFNKGKLVKALNPARHEYIYEFLYNFLYSHRYTFKANNTACGKLNKILVQTNSEYRTNPWQLIDS